MRISAGFSDAGQDLRRHPSPEFFRAGQLAGEHQGVQAGFVDDRD